MPQCLCRHTYAHSNAGWLPPSKMGGRFSATCWFYGRDIYDKLEPKRPIGLMGAYVGGTPDQVMARVSGLVFSYAVHVCLQFILNK